MTMATYLALLKRSNWAGRFTAAVVLAATIVVFFYFLPLWLMLPMSNEGFAARMWFNNADLGNWL